MVKRFKRTVNMVVVQIVGCCCLAAQGIDLGEAKGQISKIGSDASQLVGGVIGLVAIGRAAYKFAHGEHDSTTSLISGIVAVVLGQIAAHCM
jgi:hypothetical protein